MENFVGKFSPPTLPRLGYKFLLNRIIQPPKPYNPVILATTTKSGTHYIRLFSCILSQSILSLGLQASSSDSRLCSPNSWHRAYIGFNKPSLPLANIHSLRFSDIPRIHLPYQNLWSQCKVVHTFRNPLINLVFRI